MLANTRWSHERTETLASVQPFAHCAFMAVWQATFLLVPHERVSQLFADWYDASFEPAYVESLPTENARDLAWWSERQPAGDLRRSLDALAPRIPSWASDVEWWGQEEGDRFDVYTTASRITELMVRFDLREPNETFIAGIADVAAELQADFVDEHNMLYEGTVVGLSVGLRNSAALRFVQDPLAFLARVRAERPQDS